MPSAAVEPVSGRSRELGIAFETVGGAQWCSPAVTVQLTAPNATGYKLDHAPFALMLGRIRAIVVDQCPATEQIVFDGAAAGQRVFIAETTKLTQWRRFVALDPQTQKPICQGVAPDPAECDKRAAAYATAKHLMRGALFDGADLETLLDTGTVDHLVWRTPAVSGKLQLTNPHELGGQIETTAALGDAMIAQSAQECVGTGGLTGQVVAGDYVGDLAFRSLACQPAGNRPRYQVSVMVAGRSGWFYVFSLLGEDANAAIVDEVAGHLMRAIGAQ